MIVNFEAGHIEGIIRLWNNSAVKDGYKELITESFENIFTKNLHFKMQSKHTAEVLFFNTMMLPWYIPDTPLHEHNNAPGAPVGGCFHTGLLENGYIERTRESAMYLDLDSFSIPEDISAKEWTTTEMGYEVTLFDSTRHFGIVEMLNGLDNSLWLREISDCTACGIPGGDRCKCWEDVL